VKFNCSSAGNYDDRAIKPFSMAAEPSFRRHSSPPAYRAVMGILRVAVSAVLILGLAAGAGLEARTLVNGDKAGRPSAVAAAGLSMDQAVKMAEQRFRARVVRAEAEHEGVHTVYVLKLLNEAGRVWTVRVDATNGAIL
jgi:hypothetical protein